MMEHAAHDVDVIFFNSFSNKSSYLPNIAVGYLHSSKSKKFRASRSSFFNQVEQIFIFVIKLKIPSSNPPENPRLNFLLIVQLNFLLTQVELQLEQVEVLMEL